MKIINFNKKNFYNELNDRLLLRQVKASSNLENSVRKIIDDVRKYGDKKLLEFAKKYDKVKISKNELKILNLKKFFSENELDFKKIKSFKKAITNLNKYHKKQFPTDYEIINNECRLQSLWKPIDSVGIYVPGGSAVYPSSLIMSIIPAKIAGVKRIVCVTPPSNKINPYLAYLLDFLKIDEVYQVGGAQAIAALTYGTKTIKPVNKIFGPGNAYVAAAKKNVFGKVGIDIIAGPSEIVVVADKSNNPKWVACDLMAQAEHDENSQSILITNNLNFIQKVLYEINQLINTLSKKETIKKSLKKNGLIILMDNIKKSHEIINYIAPEHLHIQSKEKNTIFKKVNNAGGIFLGDYAAEVFGDYIVGTNHVLPTFGSAKFSSGLGVIDFMKKTSVVEMNKNSFKKLSKDAENIAEVEKLTAHKLSVKIRQT
tara:strand:+ start:970 stop:2253 length:1284 start_codon:yes stop_codon:yes gene_type:complete